MNDYDVKEKLFLILIIIIIIALPSSCSYDIGKIEGKGKAETVQELCSKTEYDSCVKVQQKPIYTLKNDIG